MILSSHAGQAGALLFQIHLPLRSHQHRETLPIPASARLQRRRPEEARHSLLQL